MQSVKSELLDLLSLGERKSAAGNELPPAFLRTRELLSLYHGLGYATFPCVNKVPIKKGWQDAEIPEKYTREYLAPYVNTKEFIVVLKETDLVIDIDPRSFPVDERNVIVSSWERLLASLELTKKDFLPTLVVTTPRLGQHVYLTKPAEVKVRHTVSAFPGLEFKSKGRYVLGAGSVSTFGEYAVKTACLRPSGPQLRSAADPRAALSDEKEPQGGRLSDQPTSPKTPLHACPARLLNFIEKKQSDPSGIELLPLEYHDTETNFDLYREFLKTYPPAVEGNRGDETTYIAACRGRAFGLSPEATTDILLEEYNGKCRPPWDPEMLFQKVKNAYAYDTEPQGEWCPERLLQLFQNEKLRQVAGPDHHAELNTMPGAENKVPDVGEIVRFDLDKNGKKTKTLNNCVLLCRTDSAIALAIRYNLFTNAIEIIRPLPWHKNRSTPLPVWTDEDTIMLKLYLASRFHCEFATIMCFEAVIAVSLINPTHPVRDYLERLVWDGQPRLETWLTDVAGVPGDGYGKAVQSLMIRSAVARVCSPGIKYDHLVILEGGQGIGKSGLIHVLGGNWFSDAHLDPMSRDTVDAIQGKWFIEIPEMKIVNAHDVDAIKAFISRQTDRARLAYGRITRDFPRQCVFVGSINPDEVGYLKDETGNRRFLPVLCKNKRFDFALLKNIRDQLFAEAYADVQAKKSTRELEESLEIPDKLKEYAINQARERMVQDPYEEIITNWMIRNGVIPAVTTMEIYETVLQGTPKNMTRSDQIRVSKILRKLGYHRRFVNKDGFTGTVYEKEKFAGDKAGVFKGAKYNGEPVQDGLQKIVEEQKGERVC